MTLERPDGLEVAAVAVPLQPSAGPAGRRARLVAAGWLLGLAGVAALGVSGQERAQPAPIPPAAVVVTVPGTPSPAGTPAPTIPPTVTGPIARHRVTQYRSLGDDGLVGGIPFGDNVRSPDGPS